jgi:hypothetical protein
VPLFGDYRAPRGINRNQEVRMKTIKMLSAACAVVFAFTALSASAATAHEWLEHKVIPLTKSVKVKEYGARYEFADEGARITFECTVEQKGTVGPGAAGQIASFKVSECRTLEGCEASQAPTLEAVHLPWSTELVTFESGLGNTITTKGAEWKWTCMILGSNWTEHCTIAPTMNVTNLGFNVEEAYKNEPVIDCFALGSFHMKASGVLQTENDESLWAK